MPIIRYVVWVGTSLLAVLLVANWFLPDPPREVAHEGVDAPVIRIRARWQSIFQRPAPAHLARHLLFTVIAYRLRISVMVSDDFTRW
jgi:hypothetical protein